MKFVHIADVHFDVPFTSLSGDDNLIQKRKLEQREVFRSVIEYIKENGVDYLFIAGDLYENEYITNSTIDFINDLFKQIPDTKIFISPGNHDPYIKDCIYDKYNFSSNVKVFKTGNIEKYEDENIEVYGMAFQDFYKSDNSFEDFLLQKSSKPQILVAHCDLNGIIEEDGEAYNPISESKLKALNFDYAALGHIHKYPFDKEKKIMYSGSLISLGFDEPGEHGMIIGEFKDKYLNLKFEQIDKRNFLEKDVNVECFNSQNELIEYLTTLYFEKNEMVKIKLIGRRKFVIDTKEMFSLIDNANIIKIKNQTTLAYDLEKIANENSLKGLYVRKLINKKKLGFCSDEEIDRAIEIGLEAME